MSILSPTHRVDRWWRPSKLTAASFESTGQQKQQGGGSSSSRGSSSNSSNSNSDSRRQKAEMVVSRDRAP